MVPGNCNAGSSNRSLEAEINSAAIPGVLCCGNLVRDVLVGPVQEPRWNATVWVDSIVDTFGGNGANTSYVLARLGTPVRLLGTVGDDGAGDEIVATLSAAGVEMRFVARSRLPTPATVALVHASGARALLHRPGASREAFAEPFSLLPEHVAGCTSFHLANVFGLPALRPHAAALLKQAREAGLLTAIDTGWDSRGEWLKTLAPCLPYVDLVFVNEDEARELTGTATPDEAARVLQQHGARDIVVKLGAEGCAVFTADEHFRSPAFRVTAVDTTGAGDCFAGGFLAGLQREFDHRQAAQFANALGALSVQLMGSTTGTLSFDETIAWIDRNRDQ